jgi:hypothetical protein
MTGLDRNSIEVKQVQVPAARKSGQIAPVTPMDGLHVNRDLTWQSVEASLKTTQSMNPPQFRQPDALIFDRDGVLVDSEPLDRRAKREALSMAAIMVPESLFANYIGRSDKAMIYEVTAAHGFRAERRTRSSTANVASTSPWSTRCVPFRKQSRLCIGRSRRKPCSPAAARRTRRLVPKISD